MPTPARIRLADRKKTAAQPQITAAPTVWDYDTACSTGDARGYTDNSLN
jgi:hypothetical protein